MTKLKHFNVSESNNKLRKSSIKWDGNNLNKSVQASRIWSDETNLKIDTWKLYSLML